MNYDIKVFSDLNNELKNYWDVLEKESDNFCFQSYDWFDNWVKNFRKDSKIFSLCVVSIKTNNEIICILPFEIEKKFNNKILKWSGGSKSDYFSPIIKKNINFDRENFINMWKNVIIAIPKVDLIYLNKQPENLNNKKNPFVLFLKNHKDSDVHSISLPDKWKKYTKEVLKKSFHIQNIRKKKLLKKEGNLKFKVETIKEKKIELLKQFIIQKNERLTSQGIKESFNTNDFNFYKEFENINLKNIKTHFSSLTLNNELIAFHWGVIYKSRFYYLLLSMKEGNLGRFSPGRLLISLLIRWSISKKIKYFDFGLGDEDYKKSWSNDKDTLYNFIQLNSFKAFFIYLFIKTKIIIKSLGKKNYFRRFMFIFKNKF